jgi:hypothetical protein
MLDNYAYYGQDKNLSLHPSYSDKTGKFHVKRRVTMASKHLLHPHMKEITKVLAYCGIHQKYFLSPFPRYILNSCCASPMASER